MIIALWVVVILFALVIFGPMLMEMLRQPGQQERREVRTPTPAWQQWLAVAVVAVVIVLSVLSYFGFFGLSS